MTTDHSENDDGGDQWCDAVEELARRLLSAADRFAFPLPPNLRPLFYRQALISADRLVLERLLGHQML